MIEFCIIPTCLHETLFKVIHFVKSQQSKTSDQKLKKFARFGTKVDTDLEEIHLPIRSFNTLRNNI
jgi:hypothetical protein